MPSAEEWMNRLYDEWPIHGRTLSTGRTLKKNAGEISLTILAEIFAWYHDGVDSLTIYTQDTDAHKFQTNAERILTENSEFTPALDIPTFIQNGNQMKLIMLVFQIVDVYRYVCNGVQREHNKKLNNGLPILHKVPPKRDYGRYFCIMAEKGGTSHGGLTEKLSPFFHAKKQEVNAYGR